MDDKKPISFHFQPYDFKNGGNAVEKSDGTSAKLRRYICGVSSGPRFDKHKERMTEKCIASYLEQANSGDVLLYPDVHGIRASEDIGILVKGMQLENGDWYTEYRLYDEDDDVDAKSLDTAKKVWKQMKGLPPYRRPMQKGFSVEGYIPPGGILSAVEKNGNVTERVIDNVLLDGVLLVPRPAYQDSIACAVYKALGEMPPERAEAVKTAISSAFSKVLKGQDLENQYFKARCALGDALDETVRKAMERRGDPTTRQELEIAFREHGNLMVDLIMKSQDLFENNGQGGEQKTASAPYGVAAARASHGEVHKALSGFIQKSRNKHHQTLPHRFSDALVSGIKNL